MRTDSVSGRPSRALLLAAIAMIATCILVPAGVAGFNPDLAHEYSLSKTWGGTGTADGQAGRSWGRRSGRLR